MLRKGNPHIRGVDGCFSLCHSSFMEVVNQAYVTNLLLDLEEDVPLLIETMSAARKRAQTVDAELSNLIRRLDVSRSTIDKNENQAGRASFEMGETNLRISSIHQQIAGLSKKTDDLKAEMDRVGSGAVFRTLRRDRAKILIQIEDREAEIQTLHTQAEEFRELIHQAEATVLEEKDRARILLKELDRIQEQLPRPELFTEIFNKSAARSHCRYFLDEDPTAWRSEIGEATDVVFALHQELRAGKYRLDKNSELVGGRSMASAEAIYAAVAMGDKEKAKALFEVVSEPSLFFHQIFNVFRVWCMGLYLVGQERELRELLRHHQYADGLRGGYVQSYIGLLMGDSGRVQRGINTIVKYEWEMWK
ncbi:hypothetical protein KAI87_06200, partial [Myxococcota bacterium]|nr:hypothetical protein [Myxococcota bacterium]